MHPRVEIHTHACLRGGARCGGVLWRTPNKSLGNHERLPQLTRLPPRLGRWHAVHTFENTRTSALGAHMHRCNRTLCTLLLQNLRQDAVLERRPLAKICLLNARRRNHAGRRNHIPRRPRRPQATPRVPPPATTTPRPPRATAP